MGTSAPSIKTVQEQVVDNLRRLILEGEFAAGDKLQQADLANRLGVSAMPVREGLRHLEAEGLVEFVPRRGAFVASLTAKEFDEIYDMREALEALALRWAVDQIDQEQIAQLDELLRATESSEARLDVQGRAKSIRSFLWTLYQVPARPHLFAAIRRYYNMTFLYQRQYSAAFELSKKRMQIYRRLLRAIENGDVEDALAAHRENYRFVREKMRHFFQQQANA
jgi:DNA-binding GntR family transcriptional regulator